MDVNEPGAGGKIANLGAVDESSNHDDASLLQRARQVIESSDCERDVANTASLSSPPPTLSQFPGEPTPHEGSDVVVTRSTLANFTESAAGFGAIRDRPGDIVGRYKLEEEIASGGMGTVWRALQVEPEHMRRTVAVKLVKSGLGSDGLLARFEAERQALAMMDHPNIATVFDAGTDASGRPFFAMEYVPGLTLTDYCKSHKLSLDRRLRLFGDLCLAVQHAHGRGVLHRDLKPGNVLVREVDGRPVVKVIDFGIAKALGRKGVELPEVSDSGQIVGTWHYMSPEQANPLSRGIDVRADVYSLGAILYELLCNRHAFKLRGLTPEEIRRALLNSPAAPPSDQLLTQQEQEQTDFASEMGSTLSKYLRRLRQDLDFIPLRCLRKDPSERYSTAQSLAEDVENYLQQRPVTAVPATNRYLFRKFITRHRFAAGLTMGAALALSLTAAGMLHAASERRLAQQAEGFASAIDSFLNDELIGGAGPEGSGAQISLNDALGRAAARVVHRFGNNAPLELRMHLTFGEALLALGDLDAARSHFSRARSLISDGVSIDRRTETGLRVNEEVLKWRKKEGKDSVLPLRVALEIATTEFGLDDPLRLTVLHDLAGALKNSLEPSDPIESRFAVLRDADLLYQEAVKRRTRVLGPNSLATLQSKLSHAQVGIVRGRSLMLEARDSPDRDRLLVEATQNLTQALQPLREIMREATATDSSLDAVSIEAESEIAKLLHLLQLPDEADVAYDHVLRRLTDAHGARHWRTREVAESWVNLHISAIRATVLSKPPVFTTEEHLRCGSAALEVLNHHLPDHARSVALALVVAAAGSEPSRAESLLLQAWSSNQLAANPDPAFSRLIGQMLMNVTRSLGRPSDSESWRQKLEAINSP